MVTIREIPAVRGYCARLSTYAVEAERALTDTKDQISAIFDRYERVRTLRQQRRNETEQELSDVRFQLSRCDQDQAAEIAALQVRAEELGRELQHHHDAAHQLGVGVDQMADPIASFRSAAEHLAGAMADGAQDASRLMTALDELAHYRQ